MKGITVAQKYSSLLQENLGINKNAQITDIGGHSLKFTQRGNSWHGRLVCWVKDNLSPMFRKRGRPSGNTFNNEVLRQFSEDVTLDTSIKNETKTAILAGVVRLDGSGVPVRVKHLRKLLEDTNGQPNIFDAKVSLGSDLDNIQARTGANSSLRLNDGNDFTVHFTELAVGENEYETALQQLVQGSEPGNFNDNNLSGKTGLDATQLLDLCPQFQTVADLDNHLSEKWHEAVQKQVDSLQSPLIPESQLEAMSNQVIDELCDEIKGTRKMNGEDLSKLRLTAQGDIANDAVQGAMQRTGLKFAGNPSAADKTRLRTEVLVRMNQDDISENGHGRLFAQTPEQALDWIVLNYASNDGQGIFKDN